MEKSKILSTVLFTLIVLQSTSSTTALWKLCTDDSCPIKNLEFSGKIASKSEAGLSKINLMLNSFENDNQISFFLRTGEPTGSERETAIGYTKGTSSVVYNCGPLAKKSANAYVYPQLNGTAIYLNGELYCSWSIELNNSTFPFELIDPPQYYISEQGYQVYYNLTQTVPAVAADYSKLPESVEPFVDGYKYKAVGSEKYLLITREANESSNFLLKVNGETPKFVAVKLKNYLGLIIECDFKERDIQVYASIYEAKINLWNLVHNAKIDGDKCLWTLPDSLNTPFGLLKLKETAYGLQIIENNMLVYFDEANYRIA